MAHNLSTRKILTWHEMEHWEHDMNLVPRSGARTQYQNLVPEPGTKAWYCNLEPKSCTGPGLFMQDPTGRPVLQDAGTSGIAFCEAFPKFQGKRNCRSSCSCSYSCALSSCISAICRCRCSMIGSCARSHNAQQVCVTPRLRATHTTAAAEQGEPPHRHTGSQHRS